MNIKARYKDIEFEELLKCCPNSDTPYNRGRWAVMRDTEVDIIIPQVPKHVAEVQYQTFTCGGPFYYRVSTHLNDAVCAHLIDIEEETGS